MTTSSRARAREILAELLLRLGKDAEGGITDETGLYGDGLALDSLEVAELSVLLEDELGSDPFNEGDRLPQNVGDVVGFYPA